ncbi:membrane protein insertase YidC [Marinobacter caseinilyticus]|uniref:membrane protein insertase YidC n=1 Tax=Marinobacter caseinilyticus TaxID=2692195 RepID=UPI00140B1B5F|nr:membrane protein insertase YidC [Marinobacter caseinilyticus]
MDIQRIVLFAGLAVVSYMMVLAWNEDYHQPQTTPVVQQSPSDFGESSNNIATPTNNGSASANNAGDEFSTPEQDSGDSLESSGDVASVSDKLITVKTDVLELKIDRVGGNIVEAAMINYDDSLNSKASLKLLQNSRSRVYMLESGLIGKNGFDSRRNGPTPEYQVGASTYELQDTDQTLTINLTYTSESGVEVTKQYELARNSYEIEVRYLINNQSSETWQGNLTGKIIRDKSPDPTAQNSMGIKSFLGLVISTPEDPYEKFDFGDLEETPIKKTVTDGWLAFLQHYFLTAWIPPQGETHQFQTSQRNNLYVMGFVSPATVVEPGQTGEAHAKAYVGPKIIDRLETVAPNLDRTVDFGFLFFIALPLFIILDWFHSLLGNWGVAIILLTVLVKGVFFHLSATSYRSMARMRAVAPQLTRLRELHGDDKQRMSQEMMGLYKREKINPLGGCLPILVQMPVFIALYWVLFESVQLRHAPFMLWIHDLSVMDPYFILPILMGTSMFIQMSLNPTPPDPMQAKVMKMMPVIFTVFFLWFPAGLVLYWLVNNILSISQQWYITRKIEAEAATKKY